MPFGAPLVTGYSAFFDPTLSRQGNGAEASYNNMPRYGRENVERLASFALSRGGFRGIRRVMRALNGAAPGAVANETYSRVGTADQGSANLIGPGGARPIETFVVSVGSTTTAQRDYINNFIIDKLFNTSPAIPYPTDLSGNGSGGRLGI